MAIKLDLAFCRRIAFFAVFLHLVSGLHCPIGWDGYGSSCYKVVLQSALPRGLNWENARRDCLGSGGDLVSIANQSEMSFVSNKSISNQHYWIGLNDQRNESLFVWSDGTPFNASVYSNWQSGEPNDRGGEDCVELHRKRWNDNGCKEEFGYICEKPKGPPMHVTTVMPPVTSALECPNGWDGYGNSCYMFVIQSSSMRGLNWENARRDCLGYGGDLVSIASQSEMSFVYSKSSKVWTQRYWIGLNDRLNESQFVWSDGTPFNASVYSNWYPTEPNNQEGEDCVELYRRRWNDENCKNMFGYICEKPRGAPAHVTAMLPNASVPPRILSHVSPTSVICEKYTLCCLFCYATSHSPVTYSWTKNGQDPINDDIKVVNNNIVITPRSAEDYGVYLCNASNSFGSTTYEITLTEDRKSSTKAATKEDDIFSNIYFVIVIALSGLVLVLLIVISLLAWRLRRTVNNKREKTSQRHTSDEREQRKSTRDQHAPEELPYMELKPGSLEKLPQATSNYQSLKGAVDTSSAYYNAGFNLGKSNQEDEIYYEIGNAQC